MNPKYQQPDTEPSPASVPPATTRGRRGVYVSGELEIDFAGRELRTRGIAVPIGSRALEVIEVLVQSLGKVVSKDFLMARVWPGAIVTENTLEVHISAIRKALGPGRGMLKTVSGRGYCLMGTWTIRQDDASPEPEDNPEPPRQAAHQFLTNIPVAASALIGREAAVQQLRDLLSAYRVVTMTGPGGIGKTVLATEVTRRLFPTLESDALLVELVSLSDPALVPSAVASALGLQLGGEISPTSVARAIGGKKLLLVLDNCEHVIDAAAEMAEMLVRLCPRTSVLATSREVLRIEGEFVYRVTPLEVPSPQKEEQGDLLEHSAIQLFIARTRSLRADFSELGENLELIGAICRRLDGIPLALEFAAARAATLGIRQVAGRLDDRFALLTGGRRTALPRHQTLKATLDWSYELLPEQERRLLRRLAIFPARFTLEAATAVMGDNGSAALAVMEGIPNLVAKSLVTMDGSAPGDRWRLLETIRVYLLEKLADSGEAETLARRHAEFFRDLVASPDLGLYALEIDNFRAALDWCFSPGGDAAIGIALAATVAPAFLSMSLIPECHRWSERALLALDDATRGGTEEMQLQASLGTSLMHMQGESEAARTALNRSLDIAHERGEVLSQMGLLGMSHMFHLRGGDYKIALDYAERSSGVAASAEDPAAIALARSMVGRSLHLMGDLGGARAHLEAALDYWSRPQQANASDHPHRTRIALARTLWLQGHPAQAVERAHQAIHDAERMGHPVSLSVVLAWAISVFLWTGDLRSAEIHIDWFIANAASHSLAPFAAVGLGRRAVLAIHRGDAKAGVESLSRCLQEMHATRYELLTTEFNISLAQGLLAIDRLAEAMTLIDATIQLVEANGDVTYMPELLRVKGGLLLANGDDAEACFVQSLELSRRLGTRGWELRTAIDLASLRVAQGQAKNGRALLQPVFEQFGEGFETADLQTAARLLTTILR